MPESSQATASNSRPLEGASSRPVRNSSRGPDVVWPPVTRKSTSSNRTGDNIFNMPYRDPEQRTAYQREYKRLKRVGDCQTPSQTLIPAPFRLKTAHDVLALLAEQVQAVRDEQHAGTLEKARTIGYLAGIALKAIEAGDVAARLEAVEAVLKGRRAS